MMIVSSLSFKSKSTILHFSSSGSQWIKLKDLAQLLTLPFTYKVPFIEIFFLKKMTCYSNTLTVPLVELQLISSAWVIKTWECISCALIFFFIFLHLPSLCSCSHMIPLTSACHLSQENNLKSHSLLLSLLAPVLGSAPPFVHIPLSW